MRSSRSTTLSLSAAALSFILTLSGGATRIPFENAPDTDTPTSWNPDYGSRVDGPLMDGFRYGDDEGFTPNITFSRPRATAIPRFPFPKRFDQTDW